MGRKERKEKKGRITNGSRFIDASFKTQFFGI